MNPSASARSHRGLQLIAAFKFLKATVLVAAGFAALGLLDPDRVALTEAWLERLALRPGHRLVAAWAARAGTLLSGAGSRRVLEVAIGAFLYAGLFLVEGVGLARARRWAEYLTVIASSSYLPFELLALRRHPAAAPAGTILLNIAVVAYLVAQLRADRRRPGPARGDDGGDRPSPA